MVLIQEYYRIFYVYSIILNIPVVFSKKLFKFDACIS
jgi:hypothetical protein